MVDPATRVPRLAMEMGIEAPPDAVADFGTFGDPLAQIANGSGGTGGPAGIGNGRGRTLGDGSGPGAGGIEPGTVYRAGNGVTQPVLIVRVEPEFSEEARKAKYSGVVQIRADIDTAGQARNLRIVKSVGMGLDEKAVEAVAKWRFRPGTKDGKPVSVSAVIEVSFRLL
jgi:TonB family protein